jgi:hypothetical protein
LKKRRKKKERETHDRGKFGNNTRLLQYLSLDTFSEILFRVKQTTSSNKKKRVKIDRERRKRRTDSSKRFLTWELPIILYPGVALLQNQNLSFGIDHHPANTCTERKNRGLVCE